MSRSGYWFLKGSIGCFWVLLPTAIQGETISVTTPQPPSRSSEGGLDIHICCPSGFLSTPVETGSIIDQTLADSPVSIGIPPIEDLPGSRLEDTVTYIPGLHESTNQAGYSTAIAARGFHTGGEVFVNGHRDNQHFYIRDSATIDRVEILKGHSSVLYGSGSPGATINYLTKRPLRITERTLSAITGSQDFQRIEFDSSGSLNPKGTITYRFITAAQDGGTLYKHVEDKRMVVAPSFQWWYSDYGSLRLETEYARDRRPFHFGTVTVGHKVIYDQSYVFPEANADKRYGRISLYWNHQFSQGISAYFSASRFETLRDDTHIGFYSKLDESTLSGYYRTVLDDYHQTSAKSWVRFQHSKGNVTHHALIGVEYNFDDDDVKSKRNIGGFTLDIFNPDFNIDLNSLPLVPNDYRFDNTEKSAFLFDSIALDSRWTIDIGARFSLYRNNFRRAGTIHHLSDNDTLSHFLGISQRLTESTHWHLHFSESFEPNWGTDRNDEFFDPTIGRQIELGFRHHFTSLEAEMSLAIYRLTQSNLLIPDPQDPEFNTQMGERESQGLEWHMLIRPLTSLDIDLGYSYIDAKITRDDKNQGNAPASVPAHSGAIRIDYRPNLFPDTKFTAGIVARSPIWVDDANSFELPGYARLDLGASFRYNNWEMQFSVSNALDKQYVIYASADDDIYPGEQRRIRFRLSYKY